MEPLDTWAIEGSFSRNYTVFGLLVVVLFCGLWLLDIWPTTLYFFSSVSLLFFRELNMHKIIEDHLVDINLTLDVSQFLTDGIVFFILSVISFMAFFGLIPIFDFSGIELVPTYCKSLAVSTALFFSLRSTKCFLLYLKKVQLFEIRCGFFAILHRLFVVVRCIIVTPAWLKYFSNSNSSLLSVIQEPNISSAKCYLVVKMLYMAQVVWDVDMARRSFTMLGATCIHEMDDFGECCECGKQQERGLYRLRCNDVFCKTCAYRALDRKPLCPVCGKTPTDIPLISFYDGEISLSAVFCCF